MRRYRSSSAVAILSSTSRKYLLSCASFGADSAESDSKVLVALTFSTEEAMTGKALKTTRKTHNRKRMTNGGRRVETVEDKRAELDRKKASWNQRPVRWSAAEKSWCLEMVKARIVSCLAVTYTANIQRKR